MLKFKGMTIGGVLRRAKNGCNKRISRVLKPLFLKKKTTPHKVVLLGMGDGSWPVVQELLPQKAVCYCVGVGVDATFDIALAEFGHEVHSFDPTPNAIDYAKRINFAEKNISFHPIGVWHETTKIKFYAPSNKKYANYSFSDIHGTREFIEADCLTLEKIMEKMNHNHIDLLKMDVEGSWETTLNAMISRKIFPDQLCVEMDSPTSLSKICSMVKKLNLNGYDLLYYSNEDFLFTRNNSAN